MKSLKRSFLFALAIAVLPLLFSSPVWAGVFSQQAGEPPFGFSVDGNAKGTKLSGVIAIKAVMGDIEDPMSVETLVVTIRLRKGNDNNIKTFAVNVPGCCPQLDLGDADGIQTAIINAISPFVASFGFNNPVILVKSLENSAFATAAPDDNCITQVMDIVLAVKNGS